MTWTAHATVQDVSDGPAPISVVAQANADDEVTGNGQTGPAIVSNTEGKIRYVEIRLLLDEDETSLKPGDVITLNGHFTGTAGD